MPWAATWCACSRPAPASVDAEPSLDDVLGHSFCYASSAAAHSSFRHGISSATLFANSSIPILHRRRHAAELLLSGSALHIVVLLLCAAVAIQPLLGAPLPLRAHRPWRPALRPTRPRCALLRSAPLKAHQARFLLIDPLVLLEALVALALAATKAAYLDKTDQSMGSHQELAVTAACLLLALVRDNNVYVLKLGDSRAVVAQRTVDDDGCAHGIMRMEDIGMGFRCSAYQLSRQQMRAGLRCEQGPSATEGHKRHFT